MTKIPKIDVGLVWAKFVNIWGQMSIIAGMANFIMMLGVFYTVTIYPNIHLPLWIYVLFVISATVLCISFIMKYGISGYFRFFSNQSELSEVNRKISIIMKHLNISEENKKQ